MLPLDECKYDVFHRHGEPPGRGRLELVPVVQVVAQLGPLLDGLVDPAGPDIHDLAKTACSFLNRARFLMVKTVGTAIMEPTITM